MAGRQGSRTDDGDDVSGRAERLPAIITALRQHPQPAEALLLAVNRSLRAKHRPEVHLRTVQHDLAWMQQALPDGLRRIPRGEVVPAPPAHLQRHRWFYLLQDADEVVPVPGSIGLVTGLEALALATARALLALPPAPGAPAGGEGPLADALGRLMRRMQLDAVPEVLAVAPGMPEAYDPATLVLAMAAIRCGDDLHLRYRPLARDPHPVLIRPVRLALAETEPYLLAWDHEAGLLKTYKVARIEAPERRPGRADVPMGLDAQARERIASGFRGITGERGRVVFRVSPQGIPHVRDRRLGVRQTWEDLPDGWARVAFTTGGLNKVRHWLLQFGRLVVVEEPRDLAHWIAAEAADMAEAYRFLQETGR